MTEKLLTPNNMAAILLVLTFWLPGLFLPEGTTIDLGMDDSPKKMKELDLTTVEMPDIQKQSTKEIIDRWDCEIGFWDSDASLEVWFCDESDPEHFSATYENLNMTRMKFDEQTGTMKIKIKGEKGRYDVRNPEDDPTYFENHIRQILARAFMHYHAPIIKQEGTAPYSWPLTGAVVASMLYNDHILEIEYELPLLKDKTDKWKGVERYEGRREILEACDYTFYELTQKDKYMHSGEEFWRISMFMAG